MGTVRGPRIEDEVDDDDDLFRTNPLVDAKGPTTPRRGEDGGFRLEWGGMALMIHD